MHGLVSAPRARIAAMLGGGGLVPSFDLNFARLDNPVTKYGFSFTRATTATYVNSTGLIATAASGELRYTYDPVTLSALGVLIEEQRTNLLLNTDTLSTQSVTVTAVAHTLSFYGTGTVTLSGASTAGPLTGSGAYPTRSTLTFTPTAGSLTLTVTGSVRYANLEVGSFATSWIPTTGTAATRNADVLSLTGAAGRTNLIVGSAAPITQNVTVTAVPYTLSQTGSGTITLSGASTAGPLVGAGSLTFTPSAGTLTLTMSGSPAEVQLETGSTATTYIPTTSGPRTVENVASWFNGDAGTMYAEYRSNGVTSQTSNVFAFYDIGASGTNRILLYHSNAGKAQTQIDSQSSAQMTSSSSMTAVTTAGTRIQAALAYAKDDGAISAQGASATADTSLILPVGMYQCGIGRSNYATALFNGTISRLRYYPRRLPNATLQSLTT